MLEKLKYYVVRASIFLMIVALVVGIAGCAPGVPGFTAQYNITISSTIGGTVTDPGEGLFSYDAGRVVNLVAEPDIGYRFAGWTTNADTIADVYDATTTITMNKNYCFVIANFNHY
jgi:hypothetical protein